MTSKFIGLSQDTEAVLEQMGLQIKYARLRRSLSSEEVAKAAGISRATLVSIEKGSPSVALGYYALILHHLGNLDRDLLLVSKNDASGRDLQDRNLPRRQRAPKAVTLSPAALALAGKGDKVVITKTAPAPIGPYSQAIKSGKLLFISGQIGIDPNTGKIEATNIEDQTRQALMNLGEILGAAGLTYKNVVKTTVFLQSMEHFTPMNSVYAQYFGEACPARSAVEVAKLPKGALVEIEAIADISM